MTEGRNERELERGRIRTELQANSEHANSDADVSSGDYWIVKQLGELTRAVCNLAESVDEVGVDQDPWP